MAQLPRSGGGRAEPGAGRAAKTKGKARPGGGVPGSWHPGWPAGAARSEMRTRLLPSLASFLGALLFTSLCSAQEPVPVDPQEIEGQPVVEIELIGLQQITPKAVQALMQTRVGEPFRVAKLEADIRTLTTKVFSSIPSVSAELVPEKKGVVVTIAGGENRRLVGVVFFGGIENRRDDLEPLVRSRRGGYTDDFLMEVDRREIQRYLVRQGHHFAQVSAVKNLVKGGDILVFRLVEGPKVHLRDVYLEGADSFERDELLREMPYTREPGFLGFSKQTFILEEVQKDEKQLTRYYRDRGFLNAQVTLYDWRFTSDNEDVDLFYRVEEGKPFVVEEVQLEGVTLFDPELLRGKMKTTTGSRYEPGVTLAQDIRKLQLEYHRRGWVSGPRAGREHLLLGRTTRCASSCASSRASASGWATS
jgi:outer membrane protein assembly factor BamA